MSAEMMNMQIVLAHVSDAVAIGRKFWIEGQIVVGGQGNSRIRSEAVKPELAIGIEKQVLGIGRPMIAGNAVANAPLQFALIPDFVIRRRQRRQPVLRHQDRRLACAHVNVPKLAARPALVAKNVRDLLVVGAPVQRLWLAAGENGAVKYLLDSQLLRARSRLHFLSRSKSCKQKTDTDND